MREHLVVPDVLLKTFREYYDDEVHKQNNTNIDHVQLKCRQAIQVKNIEPIPKDLLGKIQKHCTTYKFDISKVIQLISQSKFMASFFVKKIEQQNFGDSCQIKYIEENCGITFIKLPHKGKGCYYLYNGEIVTNEKTRWGLSTKPLKYARIRKIRRKKYSEYIFNKCAINTTTYTKQMRETIEFLEQAKQYVDKHDDEIMFTVILDGEYFSKNISKLNQYICDRVIVCDSDKYCKK